MAKEIKDVLVSGEQVKAQAHLHKAIFIFPSTIVLLAVLVGVLFHWLVGLTILFLSLYPVSNAYILFKTTRLLLTDRRILLIYGFFNQDVVQFKFDKVESASLENPLLGRILGYSTVVIRGVGTGAVPVRFVMNGERFVRKTEEALLKPEN
ncbi:MAG: PH domain-containing protein [Rhodospirillales bacterium]|nr:PH domain-containing protein [Rhodospirillales bacterium]